MRSRRPAMALPFSHHLLLLLLHLLLRCCSSHQLSPSDASALLDIRRTLRDLPGSHFFSSWDIPSADPCSFSGVTCSFSGDPTSLHVSILTLGNGTSPGLAGNLSGSLTSLTYLTDLIISPGSISGSIPSTIGSSLRRLRLLSISNNLISGEIPPSLSTLPQLHTLDLSHNRLTGNIPQSLLVSSSQTLKVLILASNGLSGELPSDLSTTSSQILHIDIRNNAIDGVLPPLPSTLRYFSAAANSLSGTLDAAFGGGAAPPELAFLDLSMNVFTGEIPAEIFSLSSLSYILLQRNNLSGAVPATAPSTEWAVVDLSHNELSGEAPAGLAGAESLFLNSNRLTGAVPEEYTSSVYGGTMTTFYAQQNFLTGFAAPPLPMPEFASVCLAYNCMVTPPEAAAGCPAGGGGIQRPPEQCGGGGGGG